MACEAQVDFVLAAPVLDVFNYLSSLPWIAHMKVQYVDRQRYVIHLSSGASLASWGEDITMSFYDPLNGGTRIVVNSKPKVPITLMDYGKNKKNIMNIQQYVVSLYSR